MGGKTSKSAQTVSIPPEVLARYNAVNARASAAANTPFERYSGQFVAPLTGSQMSGMSNINAAANQAQPYYGAATGQLMGAQQAAMPYYQGATDQLNQGINVGNQLAGQSYNTLNTAQNQAGGIQQTAYNNLNAAYSGAQPYNQAAGGLYQQGLEQGRDFAGQSSYGTQQALSGAQPFQQAATQYMNSGAQAVNPNDLGADQINKYMSPYLNTVLQGTAGLLNQQNQQQQAGQMGNAIRSGAFGGDRGGIAAANLNQQQNLANSKIYSDILNQGFGQALGTAQQQQQLGLGAAQANRAAQQQASQQALAIGQQGFGQGLSAAQQQAALGQQLFGMGSTTGQNAAALGQQVYGQGTGTAAQQAAMGQQVFNQGATAAAQQAALGQQQFGQGNAASQQAAALGQGIYGLGANTSSQLAALGTGAQNAAIQGGQAQMNAGQVEQATNQALDTALANQFKEEKSYPFQVAKFESDIAQGTGALSGSTTTTAQPGGFFSDARLKENVQKVGKTYDGQHIYRYNYKGDPTTQIGLIAQEVERHHPDAVGSSNHYRTVDYDKATDKAADRGHFYAGGLVNSMGGSVNPMQAGQGYADGGLAGVDPAYMAELYRQLHEITAGRGIDGMKGIPTTDAQIRELMLPRGVKSGLGGNNVSEAVDAIDSVGELGNAVGAWDYGDKGKKALGGEVDDLENKKRDEEAGLAKAVLEQNKPDPAPTGLSAPVKSDINPITPVKIEEPKAELKFGEKSPAHKLAVATAPVKPTNHGSETINDIGKLVQIGASLSGGAANGGRIHRDLGGAMPYSSGDSIVPEGDSQKHQLMTAQGTGAGGGGNGKAIGQIAGLASSLIPGGGIVKKGLGIVSKIFSDERMKENIRPIGELFDGQKVHSFNYKGDPRTQIGLIAQEVEHHRPHAVDHVKGMKTVDYDDATQHAVDRGHFAEGGMPEEGMDDGLPPVISPGLVGIHRKLNPLAAKMANFQDRLEQERYSDLNNLDNKSEGLGAADASPPPAENMLQRDPIVPNAGAPKASAPKKPSKPGLTAPIDNAPLPTGIAQIARLIHSGEGTGKNPSSSAKGPYQFIDSTFIGEFRKNYPDRAKGMSDREIVTLKHSPEGASISSEMGPRFIANNAKIIERGGHRADAGNVYLAHFLGPDTAVKVLNADPSAPISRYVSQEAINANPPLQKNPTVGGAINWAHNYMGQQAKRLSRQERAFGGLAGRDGYAEAGVVAPTYSQSQQEQIDFEENRRKEAEKADLQKAMQGIEFKDDIPAPGMGGLKPEATKPMQAGLAAQTTATPEQMAQIGNSEPLAGNNPKLAPTNGAIGRSTQLIAPGLVGANPNLVANKGAIGPASNVAGTTPVAGLAGAQAKPPERANVFKRVLGLDPAKPYDSKTNNKFFQRLGHGETDAVLSALKGIAAMGTAPTRSLGVALSAGIGAGADAYQGQRAFDVEKRKTAAQEMQARAAEQQAASGVVEAKATFQNAMNSGLTALQNWAKIASDKIYALDVVGKKDPELNSQYDQALEKIKKFNLRGEVPSAGLDIPSATPAAPAAGGATTPPPEAKGPVTMGAIDLNADEPTLRKKIFGLQAAGMTEQANTLQAYVDKKFPPEAMGVEALEAAKAGAADLTQMGENLQKSYASTVILNQLEGSLDRTPGAWQGPLSPLAVQYGSTLNQLLGVFGVDPIVDPAKLANAEEAQKESIRLQNGLAGAFSNTAGSEVIRQFIGATPSLVNTEEGARRLISGVRQAHNAAQAEYKFYRDFKGSQRDRVTAFQEKYKPGFWAARSEADYNFSKPENRWIVEAVKKDPTMNFKINGQPAVEYFNKNYPRIQGAAGIYNLFQGM